MKNTNVLALSLAVCISSLFPTAWADQIVLAEGTPVQLKFRDTVSSGKNQPGDTINLVVLEDILADDGKTVLVKAGSAAWGTVADCKKRGMIGSKGELAISIDGTKAIDGKKIPLRANISREGQSRLGATVALSLIVTPLFLLMKGKDAKMLANVRVSAFVDRDTLITANPTPEIQTATTDAAPTIMLNTDATVQSVPVPEYLQKYSESDEATQASNSLKALDQLKAQGLLTQEEYDAKKQSLSAKK